MKVKEYIVRVERHEETITPIIYKVYANSETEAMNIVENNGHILTPSAAEATQTIDCSDEVVNCKGVEK